MKIELAIEEYQCSGCVAGGDTKCGIYKQGEHHSGCTKHVAGTIVYPGVGTIFLGMPKGFNRMGPYSGMKIHMFTSYADFMEKWNGYNMWNIPVWKYRNENGHIFLRGLSPRNNCPLLHIILEDCLEKFDCLEITQKDLDEMD